ncbi:hypothetical protein ORV05_04970 [Amycolatopsis cynarae]|uniref:Uncharacterized protein n=1 Tax=Amycolatopsis cynarae TaxID=2995223 RepID=A0ABY7B4A0_9PSEU|nr:hypothetical protein [Amycolatopsis sp. HUAS 11-8]WAL67144.1 hypothetical protein ORV05_04970 [Amycolatopsis sp. HUAS 11-8]
MPLNTVQQYVRGVLDGIAIPGQTQTLPAYVQAPPLVPLDGPVAIVWGGRMRQKRQSMPRGAGFQQLEWQVDVYLSYETSTDTDLEPTVDQEFPLIVDAAMQALRTTTMPVTITDPTTHQASQILSVGENMSLEYPPERAPATLRLAYYTCQLTTTIMEVIQA